MSLLEDLKYPFGNPMDQISHFDQIAMRNVLNLAKERVWMANGRPISEENDAGYPIYTDDLAGSELIAAETSIQYVERVLKYIESQKNGTKENNT